MRKIQFDKLKELKLDKSKKETMLLVAFVLIFLIFLYFQFFLKSNVIKLFSLIPEVRKLKIDIRNIKEDLNYEEILKKKLTDSESKINDYGKKLPMEQEIPILLGELSTMAKDSYVKILGITPVSTGTKEKILKAYREIPIMINAKAGFHELGIFINKLESASRFMEVSDIKMKSNRDNFKKHDIELIISTYVLMKE